MGTIRKTIHTFDFNNDYDNVEFFDVLTTDYYRKGRPYKLFKYNGQSEVEILFDVPEEVRKPTLLHLITTECCWSGMMDIFLNGRLWIERLQGYNQNFLTREIPPLKVAMGQRWDWLKHTGNVISLKLREDAEMVYWLSDAIIEVTHKVPSTLAEITACAVADMVRNRQMQLDEIQNQRKFPQSLAATVLEWL